MDRPTFSLRDPTLDCDSFFRRKDKPRDASCGPAIGRDIHVCTPKPNLSSVSVSSRSTESMCRCGRESSVGVVNLSPGSEPGDVDRCFCLQCFRDLLADRLALDEVST